MIIAKIVQDGQIITLKDVVPTFKYSANLQMQFVKDSKYEGCILTGWYKKHKGEEYLLDIKEDGAFTLGKDIFSKEGSVYFSFALNYPDGKVVHLGIIEYVVQNAFGNGDTVLPEEQETWISVVSTVVKEQVSYIWDKDYKPQLEENLNIIDAKTEEIKAAASKVKEDALESSNNAKSALESADVAQSSANTALEAEKKALEYMGGAESAKNSASSSAQQAESAKDSALESANSASDSASNALESSNKAKEHLDNVVEKTNTFNADYTNKVNNFNSNAENANNALDKKIEDANTDINKKVLDANTNLDTKIADANTTIDNKVVLATTQANIAKQEADRAVLAMDGKLDKNLGVENAGKTMVVDADGNIVPGSALPDNVYTQEEINALLQDKMDIPYTDITITQDVNIPFTTNSIFKVDSIVGEATIKTTGKNLFDFDYASDLNNWMLNVNGWDILPIRVPKGYILVTSGSKVGPMNRYYAYFSKKADGSVDTSLNNYLYNNSVGAIYGTFTGTVDNIVYLNVTKNQTSVFLRSFKMLQLEVGRVATDYQPYIESLELKTFNPSTNVLVDGEVTIQASYPKDILAVVEALEKKVLNLQTEVVKNV